MKGFNYIVRKQEKQKICFGSGKSRDLCTKAEIDIARFATHDNHMNIGPGTYNAMESYKAITTKPCAKSFSRRGYGGLARTAVKLSHIDDNPAPNEYNISRSFGQVKEAKYPFLSTAKRKTFEINKNPGPGVYDIETPMKRRIMFEHDFGHTVKMRLGVEIKCCKKNFDICEICNEKPIGDYWHLNNRVFICRPCMIQERKRPRKHKKEELNNFRRIRDCSWIHSHEGTDAKIWLMHPGAIQKWAQKEAYICSYKKSLYCASVAKR